MTTLIPPDYAAWLAELKAAIRTARLKAGLAVNRELALLYWRIGKEILERQAAQGWGAKVIDQLARDLRAEFPDMRGLSPRNMKYMRAFAEAWPEEEFVQQAAAQIPWFHNCILLDQVKDRATREWYTRKTIENGWSRSVLELQIETAAHRRVGAAQTNFDRALPSPQSDLARDILKDPYTFDFLGITDASNELLRPALSEPLRPELFRGETRRMSHTVAGRIFPGSSVGQGVYRARGSLGGKRQGSSGS